MMAVLAGAKPSNVGLGCVAVTCGGHVPARYSRNTQTTAAVGTVARLSVVLRGCERGSI